MKIFIPLFILLSVCFSFGQSIDHHKQKIKTFKNKRNFFVKYDKFKDRTSIGFSRFALGRGINFGISTYIDQDKTSYYLIFRSTNDKWRFLRNRSLIFLADGKRIDMGSGRRTSGINSSRSRYSGVTVWERLSYPIDRETLEQLGKSETIELQLGFIERKIEKSSKRAIKDFLSLDLKLKNN